MHPQVGWSLPLGVRSLLVRRAVDTLAEQVRMPVVLAASVPRLVLVYGQWSVSGCRLTRPRGRTLR
jgi:hypothetical protein